ncbi:hypothetical protein ASE92_08315 [Pedobacter sp. Leaf41]|uniref:hypothetical protein n=1 Tax=Pedobacter sp. Leaf41 TaxID=1736218 RepID=UPI0007027F84|nr:hypothetical protein [Pedobacter sp. Leaf41]KQN36126.1 hypothetical protein ASE92_08315 [Pedobacter sp. Leaf41]
MSIPFKILATLVVLACCAINCFGQYGCRVDRDGSAGRFTVSKIYVNQQTGANTNPVRFYSNNAPYDISCPPGASSSTIYASNISEYVPYTQCFVEYMGSGNTTQPFNYYQNGRLVNFRIANCPIDDYIPMMLVGLAGVGVVAVRRTQLS